MSFWLESINIGQCHSVPHPLSLALNVCNTFLNAFLEKHGNIILRNWYNGVRTVCFVKCGDKCNMSRSILVVQFVGCILALTWTNYWCLAVHQDVIVRNEKIFIFFKVFRMAVHVFIYQLELISFHWTNIFRIILVFVIRIIIYDKVEVEVLYPFIQFWCRLSFPIAAITQSLSFILYILIWGQI